MHNKWTIGVVTTGLTWGNMTLGPSAATTVAISATGRYVAENLGAELRIYDIR
jgi:hypothetical protein